MNNTEELIPDFDRMEELATEAARLKSRMLVLKYEIGAYESRCVRDAQIHKEYWIGGKQPSMAYCDRVVVILGNSAEDAAWLAAHRNELAEVTEALGLVESLIVINRDKLDLFRTLSANERKGFL